MITSLLPKRCFFKGVIKLMGQTDCTVINYAAHTQNVMSHDIINRYPREYCLTSRLIWENVRLQMGPSLHGYIVFDDTILDKNYSHNTKLVR
ncbi:hypothetical protein Nstercoris_01463 [Nitrosomonas stercoris]|uniref:Uncharacterized protein n=1 Tax=Nitrosomonas stercoris TaxID=1444684 RepID=A0A4Y1YQA2_9PROT|nr:hypothetical protein Nstercoris_01463 [Nitrosomonas stercoris]